MLDDDKECGVGMESVVSVEWRCDGWCNGGAMGMGRIGHRAAA